MLVTKWNPNSNLIAGELSPDEKKIIDAEFSKAKQGDKLEIELLDKKGFISEEKVREVLNKYDVAIRNKILKELGLE